MLNPLPRICIILKVKWYEIFPQRHRLDDAMMNFVAKLCKRNRLFKMAQKSEVELTLTLDFKSKISYKLANQLLDLPDYLESVWVFQVCAYVAD